MTILFPSNPLNYREVDPEFKNEFESAKLQGFKIKLFDYDDFLKECKKILEIENHIPNIHNIEPEEKSETMIYRGWMLKPEYYQILQDFFGTKYTLINSAVQYKNCHYFTEVYEIIKDHTPYSVWLESVESMDEINIKQILSHFKDFFILKDYVKSEKGTDLFKISSHITPKEFKDILSEFKKKRGNLFNEGFVLKQYVNLKTYSGSTNEWRLFFLNRKLVSLSQNSNLRWMNKPDITWLYPIMNKINSNFFTIDIAEKEDGSWIIIETGDGQVSGLSPDQNSLEFYDKLNKR